MDVEIPELREETIGTHVAAQNFSLVRSCEGFLSLLNPGGLRGWSMIQNDSHSIPPFHSLSIRSMNFRLISLPFRNQRRPHHCVNRQVQKLGKNKYVYYIHTYVYIHIYIS